MYRLWGWVRWALNLNYAQTIWASLTHRPFATASLPEFMGTHLAPLFSCWLLGPLVVRELLPADLRLHNVEWSSQAVDPLRLSPVSIIGDLSRNVGSAGEILDQLCMGILHRWGIRAFTHFGPSNRCFEIVRRCRSFDKTKWREASPNQNFGFHITTFDFSCLHAVAQTFHEPF